MTRQQAQATKRALSTFIECVSAIPEVSRVLSGPGDDGEYVVTIIDAAPPDDEPRDQVYRAEMEALVAAPLGAIEFRLVNVREVDVSAYAPGNGLRIAFERQEAMRAG